MPDEITAPTLAQIPLALIDAPADAQRVDLDETAIYELAADIRARGLLQPILLRPTTGDRYEIVAGHRRYLAHQVIGAGVIAAQVIEYTDRTAAGARLAENTQREPLTPMEEARALQLIYGDQVIAPSLIAREVNRSETWVRQRLQLLDVPLELQQLVHHGELSIGHALALAQIDDEPHRNYLLAFARQSGASLAVMREWVDAYKLSRQQAPSEPPPRPAMGPAGQPVTITMPCFLCGVAIDYRELHIARVCDGCTREVATAAAAP